MFHNVHRPHARREEVRSSAEAALPPPDESADEPLARKLARNLSDALGELTAQLPHLPDPPAELPPNACRREDAIRLFSSVLEALSTADIRGVSVDRAWLGSLLTVRDLDTTEVFEYQIVPFDLVDGSLERVTVASPIGRALVGTTRGDIVELVTPTVRRRVRVEELHTVLDLTDAWCRGGAGDRSTFSTN